MIHWGWDTPAVIIWWFTACALPFKTSSVLHRQCHSQRLQWGNDVCTFSCHLLNEPFSSCLWCGFGLPLGRLTLGRCAGRGSLVTCQVTTAGHFLPIMSNLTLRRFGQSEVQPGIPVSPQHHPLQCESTSLDFNAKLRGRWELKSPLILCIPAHNLHIFVQNSRKFFAELFPFPFSLLSEMCTPHSPDCFCVSFIEGHIVCCLYFPPSCSTHLFVFHSSSPVLQILSCQMRALIWFYKNGLSVLTSSISFC